MASLGPDQEAAERTYRAIGRFMFEFSQLEYTIRHYLGEEIGVQERHFSVVVVGYDVGVLTAVAKEVFRKARSGELGARIEKLLNRFHDPNGERNRVAHGLWVPFMEGGTLHHTSRQSFKKAHLKERAKELEKRADEACRLRAELENAFTALPEFKAMRREDASRSTHPSSARRRQGKTKDIES
jgi:hypothetical protein